jgi:cyclophilin family peptidyl-prolyl cis-trans isomerase
VDITQAPPSLQNSTTTTPSSATSTPVAANTARCVRDFNQSKLTANANMNIANRQVQIKVKDFGSITVELYDKDAPLAVQNFLRLTDSGYYDCLTFHRVSKNFVIQGGDPNGTGTGGQSAFGKPFADELNPNTPSYKAGYLKGVLAMANSGANTNGSQFFIMLADNSLPHSYTIFGKVIAGQDVVDAIGQVAITPQMGPTDGAPVTPVVMESVKIIK